MKYAIKRFGKFKDMYWNGCGWTSKGNAQKLPSRAEQEEKVRRMEKDRIMAEVVEMR